jgi:DNA-binding NtrC family response regulator
MEKRILVVDDEHNITQSVESRLDKERFKHDSFGNANNAYWFFKHNRESVDLVVIDLTMQGRNGIELVERLRQMKPGIPILFVAGILEGDDLPSRVDKVIYKPVSSDDLINSIYDLIEK